MNVPKRRNRAPVNTHFVDNYAAIKAEAQKQANELGFDFGIERDYFGFRCFMLPEVQNRRGYELRCEVVHPTDLAKCESGHGPMTKPANGWQGAP